MAGDSLSGGRLELRKYLAELMGTLALVFFGCGSAVLAGEYVGVLGIAFGFGMTLLVLVYAIGPISGCHVNPAVTLAMWISKKISLRDSILYVISQCIGAVIGAFLLMVIANGNPDYDIAVNGLGQNGFGFDGSPAGYNMMAALVAEVMLTFFFIMAIFGATSKKAPQGFAGVAIGFALFMVHILGIPVTGTSVNPARSLGPAVFVGGLAMEQLWLFWVAPLAGAIIAALAKMILSSKK